MDTLTLNEITDALDIARVCGYSRTNPIRPILEVDWSTSRTIIYGRHQSERGQSMRAFNGHESTYQLPEVDALDIRARLEEALPAIRAACEQYYSRWDGSNHVAAFRDLDESTSVAGAVWDVDGARARAETAIYSAIEQCSTSAPVGYFDASDWIANDSEREIGLTALTTDDELDALAAELVENAELDHHTLVDFDDMREALETWREDLTESDIHAEDLYDAADDQAEWECIYQPHQPGPDEPPTRIESLRLVGPGWVVHEDGLGDYELHHLDNKPLGEWLAAGSDADGRWYWRPVRLGPWSRQHPSQS